MTSLHRAFHDAWPDVPIETRVQEKTREDFDRIAKRLARGEPGGAGAIVRDARGFVLLQRHDPATGWPPDAWAIPGGGVAAGERFEDGLEREVREELGIAIDVIAPLLYLRQKLHCGRDHAEYPFVFFAAKERFPGAPLLPRAGEVAEARWFHKLPKGTFDREILVRLTSAPAGP